MILRIAGTAVIFENRRHCCDFEIFITSLFGLEF